MCIYLCIYTGAEKDTERETERKRERERDRGGERALEHAIIASIVRVYSYTYLPVICLAVYRGSSTRETSRRRGMYTRAANHESVWHTSIMTTVQKCLLITMLVTILTSSSTTFIIVISIPVTIAMFSIIVTYSIIKGLGCRNRLCWESLMGLQTALIWSGVWFRVYR